MPVKSDEALSLLIAVVWRTREAERDFCDLPIRRDEGRVVDSSLVFKRVFFQEKKEDWREEPSPGWRKGENPCPGSRKHERRALVGTDWRRALRRRKHIFGNGSEDVQLSYEDDLRRTIYSSINRVNAEIREGFQQWQNLAQKYAFLRPEVILSMDELNLDQAPHDINKEFQVERVRLQVFVTTTDPDCKKELIRSGFLGLLKYIIESKLGRWLTKHCHNVENFLNICH
ncbi:uncharacterized protein TNCV_5067801 [Trichonephila clavipes]|uniref:Uncharacterized protein n=1 Tax=Trichonephila clavipes TaxID=2585209 RepID=A0A8X6V0L6_TRICX|nr:uncharacterized protein TNCV_5067801 [Trichonephila clavipes]